MTINTDHHFTAG